MRGEKRFGKCVACKMGEGKLAKWTECFFLEILRDDAETPGQERRTKTPQVFIEKDKDVPNFHRDAQRPPE